MIKQLYVLYASLIFVKTCLCQDVFTYSMDTIHYATLCSNDICSIIVLDITNTSDDNLILWVSENPSGMSPDSLIKYQFFFQTSSNRNYTLFQYLTDNGSLDTSLCYIGFSFIKEIKNKESFKLIFAEKKASLYLDKIIVMKRKEFEHEFIKLSDRWFYKYDVLLLDKLE